MSARHNWHGTAYSSGKVSEKMKSSDVFLFFHSNRNDRKIPVPFVKTTLAPRRLGCCPALFDYSKDAFKMAATNISAFRFTLRDVFVILFSGVSSFMGFLTCLVKNGEIRPSHSYKIILEQREDRDQLNS